MKKAGKKTKRLLEAEDICRLNLLTSSVISPDEKHIACIIEQVSDDKRKYYSHLHVVTAASGESRQYTFGEVNDRGQVWSPNGSRIAFVSTRDKKTGIYIIPAGGGGERLVLETEGDVSGLTWTPDGKEIVYQFRYHDSHDEKDPKKKKEAPLYRHITRLYHRLDGYGFLPKDRYHIWKLDVDSGQTRRLTKGKFDEMMPAVSPNGKWLTFVSNRSKDPDVDSLRDDLYLMPLAGGREKKIPTPPGPVTSPAFSPDSKKIAWLGHTNPDDAWGVTNFHLWTVGIAGRPAAADLLARFDRQTEDSTIGDMGEGFGMPAPKWSPDGKRLYFVASDRGSTHVFYVSAKGGLPTRVTKKDCHIKGFSTGKACRKIAAVVSTLVTPGELHLFPAVYDGDRKAQVLLRPSQEVLQGIDLPAIKEIWFTGYDGTEIQGWLVTPPKFNRKKKYPGILEIHGGPRAQYGFTFYHEMLYLATQGYVVFYTNPRGGAGRGETWAGTIIGDWGTIDYSDCMAATDYLEKLPYVDGKRLGVTGGSYGGYMTNWMVGHTNRFKAAVTQRSVVDLKSFVGSSDCGYDLSREFLGQPWTNAETYERCSPLTYADNIKTPLLIIHSEQDLRCGMEQAEQLFVRLKLQKKTVELVRFPEEPHGLSRHGRPDRRIARLEWIAKWFKRYLKK